MLTTQNYIIKNASLKRSQDFDTLRKEGVEHIARLSNALWTDYNLHDPGITILEALCYAITDLGYRTTYPMSDLLTTLDAKGVAKNDSDFHTARAILTTYPVTFDDLRKVLADIKGIRMAWIRKNNEARYGVNRTNETLDEAQNNPNACFVLRGLFDVFVEFEEGVIPKRLESVGMKADTPTGFVMPTAGGEKSISFEVKHDCILESVYVFPESKPNPAPPNFESKDIIIRLMEEGLAGLTEVSKIKPQLLVQNGLKQVVTLGFALKAGKKYRLDANGSDMKLGNNLSPAFPYKIEGVIELLKGLIGNTPTNLYYFFYDWQISYTVAEGMLQVPTSYILEDGTDVLPIVKDKLHTYRNLCEDFVRVCPMQQEKIALCADIDLAPYANIEDIEAEIFYRLSNHISPPVRFYTLAEMREKSKTTEDIFEGPQLEHGFIDQDEFRQITRLCQLQLSDIFQIIMDIEGVTAVRQIELLSYINGQPTTHSSSAEDGQWAHPLSTGAFLAPIFTHKESKVFFYKNNLPYLANKTKTEYALSEKKAQDIYTKLNGASSADLDLPVPVGTYRDLGSYASIQNDLPETYRVGRNRVPASETLLRKAQAQQLKGYLLHFDHILSNSMAQLANIKNLFGWSGSSSASSYFSPPLPTASGSAISINSIFGLENLYSDFANLSQNLSAIVESRETAIVRKGQFLDHLAARFAENLTEYSQLMRTLYADTEQQMEIIGDKKRLLARYPAASAQRLKAFDYSLKKWDITQPQDKAQDILRDNITGYQKRVYALLGFDEWYQQELAGHRLLIEEVEEEEENPVTNIKSKVKKYRFVLQNGGNKFESISCNNRQEIEALLDDALEIGSLIDNYKKGDYKIYNYTTDTLETKTRYALFKEGKCQDDIIGYSTITPTTNKLQDLKDIIVYFKKYATMEGFHVVEHLLLRKRTINDPFLPIQLHKTNEPCDCPEVTDPYSFRISVYLPSWSKRFKKIRFRQHVEKVLREECPAHIFPKICWISHDQMRDLEKVYTDWLAVLTQLPKGACCLNESTVAVKMGELSPKQACENQQRGGLTPLPPTNVSKSPTPKTLDEQYRDTLKDLIELMNDMDNVFPTARLHDCEETDGDNPEITLDNTSLGTL